MKLLQPAPLLNGVVRQLGEGLYALQRVDGTNKPGVAMFESSARALTVIAIIALPMVNAHGQDDATKKDMKHLQGLWVALGIEENGIEDRTAQGRLVLLNGALAFKDDQCEITGTLGKKRFSVTGSIKLDATVVPKRIDLTFDKGPNQGKSQLGIYDVDGDILRIRWGKVGENDRPKQLKTKKGDDFIVELYKRK